MSEQQLVEFPAMGQPELSDIQDSQSESTTLDESSSSASLIRIGDCTDHSQISVGKEVSTCQLHHGEYFYTSQEPVKVAEAKVRSLQQENVLLDGCIATTRQTHRQVDQLVSATVAENARLLETLRASMKKNPEIAALIEAMLGPKGLQDLTAMATGTASPRTGDAERTCLQLT